MLHLHLKIKIVEKICKLLEVFDLSTHVISFHVASIVYF